MVEKVQQVAEADPKEDARHLSIGEALRRDSVKFSFSLQISKSNSANLDGTLILYYRYWRSATTVFPQHS